MNLITADLMRRMVPGMSPAAAGIHAAALDGAIMAGPFLNLGQVAAFLAQVLHESRGGKFMYELWGPTAAQARYEGRADLGNTQPGDGYRYRGRGYFQLTGRANYRQYGRLLGLPLEAFPDLAAQPVNAALVAAKYWETRRYRSRTTGRLWTLNQLADAGDFRAITRAINGGENGIMDRYEMLDKAMQTLSQTALIRPQAPAPAAPASGFHDQGGQGWAVDGGDGVFTPLTGRMVYPGPFAQAIVNPEMRKIRLERVK